MCRGSEYDLPLDNMDQDADQKGDGLYVLVERLKLIDDCTSMSITIGALDTQAHHMLPIRPSD